MSVIKQKNTKRTVQSIVLLLLIISLIFVLGVRYHKLNEIDTKFDISPQDAKYGEYMQEYTIAYHIYEPSVKRQYDPEYKQEIYRYFIPFDIESISDWEPFQLEDFCRRYIFFPAVKDGSAR